MNVLTSIFLAILLAATSSLSAQSARQYVNHNLATSASQDATAILALERRDAAAAKTNDVETLVSLWTPDGVLLQPGSEPVVGITAIRQLLETQKQQTATIVTLAYEENWKERRILGGEAYEWGEIRFAAKLPNGKEISQTALAVRVLRRQQDGSWKIACAMITPGPQKG